MNTFTPGPWDAVFATANGEPVGTGAFVSKHGGSIASVNAYAMCGTDEQMREYAMAHARVMAASPDLLAVLDELFEIGEIFTSAIESNDYGTDFMKWADKAQAAMRKARGEE